MLRTRLSQCWLQVGLVVLVAVFLAAVAASVVPLGNIVSAGGDSGGRTEVPSVAVDPGQVEILEDGVVTRAEYDSAVEQTLACVRAAGGTITDLRYEDFRDRPIYTFGVTYSGAVSPEGVSPYDECWIQYSRDVQAQWVAQHEPSAATRADNEARGLACAEEENLGVSSIDQLLRLVSEENHGGAMRCRIIAFKGYDPLDYAPEPQE